LNGDVDLHFLIGKLSGKNIGLIQKIFSPRRAERIFTSSGVRCRRAVEGMKINKTEDA
jgi:hypothetical protein